MSGRGIFTGATQVPILQHRPNSVRLPRGDERLIDVAHELCLKHAAPGFPPCVYSKLRDAFNENRLSGPEILAAHLFRAPASGWQVVRENDAAGLKIQVVCQERDCSFARITAEATLDATGKLKSWSFDHQFGTPVGLLYLAKEIEKSSAARMPFPRAAS